MTLTLALRTALSGLSATQSALQVTSNNITNVNTEGYSRKDVTFSTRTINGVGAGVNVTNVDRVVDEFLIREIRDQQAVLGNLDVRDEFLSELEALFSSPDNDRSITTALDSIRDTLEALSVSPESSAAAFNSVNELRKSALQIQELSTAVQNLRLKADQEISRIATNVTSQLEIIADLNTRVARAEGLNQPSGEEKDERDRAVKKLAEFMDIRVIEDSNGLLTILTNTGRSLVSGSVTETMSHTSAVQMSPSLSYLEPGDSGYPGGIAGLFLGTPDTSNGTNDITTELTSGRLKGLIDLRDTVLPNLQSELDRTVQTLTQELNKVHNQGTPFPPLATLTGTQTVNGDDRISGSGTFTIAILNTTNNTIAETATVTFPTPGAGDDTVNVTTLLAAIDTAIADTGFTATVNGSGKVVLSTSTADRAIAINEGSFAINVGEDTRGFSHYFGLNDLLVTNDGGSDYDSFASHQVSSSTTAIGVAANSTLSFYVDDGSSGETEVQVAYTTTDTLEDVRDAINTALSAQNITASIVNDGNGKRLVIRDTDGDNIHMVDSGTLLNTLNIKPDNRNYAGTISVRSDIISDPTNVARATLSASAVAGDVAVTPGDGSTAINLAGVFDSDFTFGTAGGISAVSTTLASYSAKMLGLQAAQTADARAELAFTTQFTETLEFRASAVSGVNLDEELSNLVVLEQAFNASARIITTAADMLQELLDAVR